MTICQWIVSQQYSGYLSGTGNKFKMTVQKKSSLCIPVSLHITNEQPMHNITKTTRDLRHKTHCW